VLRAFAALASSCFLRCFLASALLTTPSMVSIPPFDFLKSLGWMNFLRN
jgi:hypothetical protein